MPNHPTTGNRRAVTARAAETRAVVDHVVVDHAKETGPDLQKAVDQAEQSLEQGRWVEHAEVEARLKRRAAGGS